MWYVKKFCSSRIVLQGAAFIVLTSCTNAANKLQFSTDALEKSSDELIEPGVMPVDGITDGDTKWFEPTVDGETGSDGSSPNAGGGAGEGTSGGGSGTGSGSTGGGAGEGTSGGGSTGGGTAGGGSGSGEEQSPSLTLVSKSQVTEVKSLSMVDILFVIDNSGSMGFEQKSMAQRMSTFVAQLSGLNYRMAATTTDPNSTKSWGDGKLLPMVDEAGQSVSFVDSSVYTDDQAQRMLGATLQRSEMGSGSEQPIRTTIRAIERLVAANSFFRDGASFSVIVISDEDESATATLNKPETLLSLVQNQWQLQKNFTFHGIIVKPNDSTCLASQKTVYGKKIQEMALLSGQASKGGAIIGSVCATDYGSQLSGIGRSIAEMKQTMSLECSPASEAAVTVMKDGVPFAGSFQVEGIKLTFASSLPVGVYQVEYACWQ